MGFRFELKFPDGDTPARSPRSWPTGSPAKRSSDTETATSGSSIEEEAELVWVEPLEGEAPT
jgi:hypothetical protein